MADNRLWLVHRPTGARVLMGTKEGTRPWHFRDGPELRGEFDQFADRIEAHAAEFGQRRTEADFALELLNWELRRAPCCFRINEAQDYFLSSIKHDRERDRQGNDAQ